jgi:hypothetical protein
MTEITADQIELKLPRTNIELDALAIAMKNPKVLRAASDLVRLLADEVELRDSRGNRHGGFLLLLEAIMDGMVDPADLIEKFNREGAESSKRALALLAALDEAEDRLKARRAVVQAGDGKLAVLLAAIECAQYDSIRAVRRQETDVEHVKHSRLVEAATAAGIDPAELTKLRPPLIDKEAENIRRHWMGTAVAPIRAVLADPLRRTESLPDWVLGVLAKMGPCPAADFSPAIRDGYLREAIALLSEATR